MSPFDNTNAIKHLTESWRHPVNYNASQKWGFSMPSYYRELQEGSRGVPASCCRQCLLPENPEGAGAMHLAGKLSLVEDNLQQVRKALSGISMCRDIGANPNSVLWCPNAAEGHRSWWSSVSPGNPFVSQWVLWHLCCLSVSMPSHRHGL